MPATFNQCPSCNSTIPPDTSVCPSCKHVVQTDGTNQEDAPISPLTIDDKDVEVACGGCGEMVRSGLVRCWNCGSFMRPDIAAAYKEMKSRPQDVIYSSGSVDSLQSDEDENVVDFSANDVDDEEGFELSPEVSANSQTFSTTQSSESSVFSAAADADPVSEPEQVEETAPVEAAEQPAAAPEPETSPEAEAEEVATSEETSEVTEAPAENQQSEPKTEAEDVDHSEATGGEALLNIALQEEKESGSKRKKMPPGMFLVFCPKGHRIKVKEKHRGLTGRCPVCKATFHVPKDDPKPEDSATANAEAAEGENAENESGETVLVTGAYQGWLEDTSQHLVDPGRLKLRPGSLTKDMAPVDVAFSEEGLLICELIKGGSLFGGGNKKKPATREEVHEHLKQGGGLGKLPCHAHRFFSNENFSELRVVQPNPPGQISLFHEIPVFGEGRIAVQLPKAGEGTDLEFLSFSLMEFRLFAKRMQEVCGVADFGVDLGIPLEDSYEVFKCHYTGEAVPALNEMDYFKADPSVEFVTVGYQCSGCGLVMSEAGREAEKFGGAKGKGIAKAKCPGCGEKFGTLVLEAIKDADILTAPATDEAAATTESSESPATESVEPTAEAAPTADEETPKE